MDMVKFEIKLFLVIVLTGNMTNEDIKLIFKKSLNLMKLNKFGFMKNNQIENLKDLNM
jgi:hypothetical protein